MTHSTKTFYMIRHGETVANAGNYASGSLDTPLTDLGKSQAENARILFEKMDVMPDVMVHSHLSRAFDTASILNTNIKLPMVLNTNLAEQFYGDWQEVSWDIVRPLMNEGQQPPNGENWIDFRHRVFLGVKEVLEMPYKLPLIVTHGGVINALCDYYSIDKMRVLNCEIYKFSIGVSVSKI